jgi:hypothetical protein
LGGGELLFVEIAVEAASGEEFVVGAGFDDAAVRQDEESIGVDDGREAR